ncbi:hypothetical protein Pmani_034495 [Petrolisthes manimaculis]|uniref:Uncharacterized protein n=1 Tax=Petrolisthes manimaculis TaxID=1843537 RepID=A0AAE1TP28_9EUCA|nr:hypothetical protein Pmani_034495 [Petrolisthes manimaculis]
MKATVWFPPSPLVDDYGRVGHSGFSYGCEDDDGGGGGGGDGGRDGGGCGGGDNLSRASFIVVITSAIVMDANCLANDSRPTTEHKAAQRLRRDPVPCNSEYSTGDGDGNGFGGASAGRYRGDLGTIRGPVPTFAPSLRMNGAPEHGEAVAVGGGVTQVSGNIGVTLTNVCTNSQTISHV